MYTFTQFLSRQYSTSCAGKTKSGHKAVTKNILHSNLSLRNVFVIMRCKFGNLTQTQMAQVSGTYMWDQKRSQELSHIFQIVGKLSLPNRNKPGCPGQGHLSTLSSNENLLVSESLLYRQVYFIMVAFGSVFMRCLAQYCSSW